jgi:hypothetical protein
VLYSPHNFGEIDSVAFRMICINKSMKICIDKCVSHDHFLKTWNARWQ